MTVSLLSYLNIHPHYHIHTIISRSVHGGSWGSVGGAHCPTASWKSVDFDVFGQVVTAGKLLVTSGALIGLQTRVGATVSG